jgi:hypothetical protein
MTLLRQLASLQGDDLLLLLLSLSTSLLVIMCIICSNTSLMIRVPMEQDSQTMKQTVFSQLDMPVPEDVTITEDTLDTSVPESAKYSRSMDVERQCRLSKPSNFAETLQELIFIL